MNSKSKKRVQFEPEVSMHHTLNLTQYSNEEFANLWYSQREYKKIRDREAFIGRHLKRSSKYMGLRDKVLCTKGLETYEAKLERRLRATEVKLKVLSEQDRQFDESRWKNRQ